MVTSTSLSGEPRASHTPGSEGRPAWAILEDASQSVLATWLAGRVRGGLYGRTCLAFSQAGEVATLPLFSRILRDGRFPSRAEDGEPGALSQGPREDTEPPGECLTLDLSEAAASRGASLSGARGLSLWDILETGEVPQRHSLSPACARTILRRAKERCETLPKEIEEACLAAIRSTSRTSTDADARSQGKATTKGRGQPPTL